MPRVAVPDGIAAGAVRMLLTEGSRALVVFDDGSTVTVCREQVTPLAPLDCVLAVGTRVAGHVDSTGTELRLDLEGRVPRAVEEFADFRVCLQPSTAIAVTA